MQEADNFRGHLSDEKRQKLNCTWKVISNREMGKKCQKQLINTGFFPPVVHKIPPMKHLIPLFISVMSIHTTVVLSFTKTNTHY